MIKYYSIKEAKAPLKAERFFIVEKEFLYVGHYIDINGNYILKVGTRKRTAYNFSQRERKANPTKATIIAEMFKFLSENAEISAENLEILNKERQIGFKVGENSFEITLTQKRKPKN